MNRGLGLRRVEQLPGLSWGARPPLAVVFVSGRDGEVRDHSIRDELSAVDLALPRVRIESQSEFAHSNLAQPALRACGTPGPVGRSRGRRIIHCGLCRTRLFGTALVRTIGNHVGSKGQFYAGRRLFPIRENRVRQGSESRASLIRPATTAARYEVRAADEKLIRHVVGRHRLAVPMVRDVRSVRVIEVSWKERIHRLAVTRRAIKIGKLERVRLRSRIESRTYRRVDIHIDLIEVDPPVLVAVVAFLDRKFRCDLKRGVRTTAGSLEDVNSEISPHFVEAGPIPVAKLPVLVEERNFAPLALIRRQFGTLRSSRRIENPSKIRIAESPEDPSQLVEKLRAVIAALFGWRRDLPFVLGVRTCLCR